MGNGVNIGKSSIMSVGSNNHLHNYCFNDIPLTKSRCERAIGVLVNSDPPPRAQCVQTRNRAHEVGTANRKVWFTN